MFGITIIIRRFLVQKYQVKRTHLSKMFCFKFIVRFVTFSLILTFSEAKHIEKLTVMLSKNYPSALKRLEMKILENFGEKLNLKIDDIIINETLNDVFNSETSSNRFATSDEYL